jgi:hypothetical protein
MPVKLVRKTSPAPASETIAADNHPNTLPIATQKVLAKMKETGVYLNEADCYWTSPNENDCEKLRTLNSCKYISVGRMTDYRIRQDGYNVEDIKKYEDMLSSERTTLHAYKQLVEQDDKTEMELRQRIPYSERYTNEEWITFTKAQTNRRNNMNYSRDRVDNYKSAIASIKAWKPVRRIYWWMSFNINNYNEIAKVFEDLQKDAYFKKIYDVIKHRKAVMEEKNKSRGNPMKSVYLAFNLTPMDYRIQASWNIHRDGYVHSTNITEYDLTQETIREYTSTEMRLEKEAEEKAEAERKAAIELKRKVYQGIDYLETYGAAINKMEGVDKLKVPDVNISNYIVRYVKQDEPVIVLEAIGYRYYQSNYTEGDPFGSGEYKFAKYDTPIQLSKKVTKSSLCGDKYYLKGLKSITMDNDLSAIL